MHCISSLQTCVVNVAIIHVPTSTILMNYRRMHCDGFLTVSLPEGIINPVVTILSTSGSLISRSCLRRSPTATQKGVLSSTTYWPGMTFLLSTSCVLGVYQCPCFRQQASWEAQQSKLSQVVMGKLTSHAAEQKKRSRLFCRLLLQTCGVVFSIA